MAYSQKPGSSPTTEDDTVIHGARDQGGAGNGNGNGSSAHNGISSFREEDTDTDASSSDSSSASGDHVADKNKLEKTPSKKEKVQMHFKRFWLFYLIAAIIFLAILLPILFKVIVPAIVQLIINKQDLPIKQGVFKALNANEIRLQINTTINSPLPADLDATTLFLYNKDTPHYSPFGNISIPKTHVSKNTRVEIPQQTVPISNTSELVKWVGHVFDQEDVDLSIRGTPPISLGALHSDPHLQKTVSIPGLRKLSGFGLTDLELMIPPDSDGNNIKGTVNIPNFGVLELDLGNLTFNLFSGKTRLGVITVYNVDLKPGNNTNNFGGQLFLTSLLPNLGEVLKSQGAALQKGNIDLNVTGNATVVNGEHIKWLEQVLNNRQVTTSVGVVTLLSDVVSGLVGNGKNTNTTIIDALEQVLGNSTLIKNIGDRLKANGGANATHPAGNSTHVASLLKRDTPQGSLMWNMLRLGMRMKMAKR